MVRMDVSARLARWVEGAFAPEDAERVLEVLRNLPPQAYGRQDPERIQAAIVIRTEGDWDEFQRRLALANRDWRDSLVAAGLAGGWTRLLDEILEPEKEPGL
jgi:hypothetical protein